MNVIVVADTVGEDCCRVQMGQMLYEQCGNGVKSYDVGCVVTRQLLYIWWTICYSTIHIIELIDAFSHGGLPVSLV